MIINENLEVKYLRFLRVLVENYYNVYFKSSDFGVVVCVENYVICVDFKSLEI